jgi:uncharacterized protein (TIGR00251 family)
MLDWKLQGERILVSIKARASGKENRVVGVHAGMLKVEVTSAPEKGKANEAICRLLAKELGISVSQFGLVRGETSSNKVMAISGITVEAFAAMIDRWEQPPKPARIDPNRVNGGELNLPISSPMGSRKEPS